MTTPLVSVLQREERERYGALATRDAASWAAWDAAHPYVHHPRTKHEAVAELKYLEGSPKYRAYMAGHKVALEEAQKNGLSPEDALTLADRHEAEGKKHPRGPERARREGMADALREWAAGAKPTKPAEPEPGKSPADANPPILVEKELAQADKPNAGIKMQWLDQAKRTSPYAEGDRQHDYMKGFSGARSLAAKQHLSSEDANARAAAISAEVLKWDRFDPGVPPALGAARGYEAHAREAASSVSPPSVSPPKADWKPVKRQYPVAASNPYVPKTPEHDAFNMGHAYIDNIIKSEASLSGQPMSQTQAVEFRDRFLREAAVAQRQLLDLPKGNGDATRELNRQRLANERSEKEGRAARYAEEAGDLTDYKSPMQIQNEAYAEAMAGKSPAVDLIHKAQEMSKKSSALTRLNHYHSTDETNKLDEQVKGLIRAADEKAKAEADAHKSLAPKTGWKVLTPKQSHQTIQDAMVRKGVSAISAVNEADRLSTTHETHMMADGSMVHFNNSTKVSAAKKKIMKDSVTALQKRNPKQPPLEVFAGSAGAKYSGAPKRFGKGVRGFTHLGHPQVWVSPATLKAGEQPIFDRMVAEHWHMPAGKDKDPVEYVMAHEYGHTMDSEHHGYFDTIGTDPVKFAKKAVPTFKDDMSRYGQHSVAEAYAESYAEWFLSGGKTTNPTVQVIAREAGWA